MLIIFFAFIYVFIVTYCWGYLFLLILGKTINLDQTKIPIPITSILGIIALATVASIFSLFWRINWEFQVVVLVVSSVATNFMKPYRQSKTNTSENRSHTLILSAVLLITFVLLLYTTSTTAKNPDTGIYHAQAIRWIETYRAIPGLANIHQRLGYNSSWMIVNAIFSFSFLGGQSFHFMTGYLMLAATVYFLGGLQNILNKTSAISDYVKIIFLLGMTLFMLDQASSPGTDIPAAILVGITMCEAIKLFEERSGDKNPGVLILFALVAFCLTVKLSAIPIFLLALPFIFNIFKFKQTKMFWTSLLTALTIILPFLARNVVLTGYLVYPGLTFSPINFDWRIPAEIVKRESEVIRWFATLPNSSIERYQSLSFKAWSREWLLDLSLKHKALIGCNILLPIIMLALLSNKTWRDHLKKNAFMLYLFASSLLGILFWFISAPAVRFGYGFLLATIAIGTALLITWMAGHYPINKKVLTVVSILGCLVIVSIFSYRSVSPGAISQRIDSIKAVIVSPREYPEWSTQTCEFKNFTMLCAQEYNSCWYEPFPCAVGGDRNVEMRSDNILDGFRTIP